MHLEQFDTNHGAPHACDNLHCSCRSGVNRRSCSETIYICSTFMLGRCRQLHLVGRCVVAFGSSLEILYSLSARGCNRSVTNVQSISVLDLAAIATLAKGWHCRFGCSHNCWRLLQRHRGNITSLISLSWYCTCCTLELIPAVLSLTRSRKPPQYHCCRYLQSLCFHPRQIKSASSALRTCFWM